MISIQLNGKLRELDARTSLSELLRELEINPRVVAVAINGEVIPKKALDSTAVRDGDAVEIVRMVGGGAGPPFQNAAADVVIVGAGVIGCAIAYALSRAGRSCVVVDSRRLGMAATNAAAGILSPLAEFERPDALVHFGLQSLHLYPTWVDRLREDVPDIDVEFVTNGVLRVAFDEEELAAYGRGLRYSADLGVELTQLDQQLVHELEPRLNPRVIGGLLSPGEGQINNQLFTLALSRAAKNLGARFVEGAPILRFLRRGAHITAVRTAHGDIGCDELLLSAGAWSGRIARKLGVELPVSPVRGQMLALGGMLPPVGRPVWGTRGYVTPRANGLVFAGSTVEHAGFRIRTTKQGLQSVRRGAFELVPQLRHAKEHFTWAGLRPAAPDGLPIIGRLSEWNNVSLATAHFRNGILLAPITGDLVATALTKDNWLPLAGFDPARFNRGQAGRARVNTVVE